MASFPPPDAFRLFCEQSETDLMTDMNEWFDVGGSLNFRPQQSYSLASANFQIYETRIIGAIGNALHRPARSSTHALIVGLQAVCRPDLPGGFYFKPVEMRVCRLGTAVIQHSELGSVARRLLRATAEYVRCQDTDEEFNTCTLVTLEIPGRDTKVVLAYHHAFRTARSWLWLPAWRRIAMDALDGPNTLESAIYTRNCDLMYSDERTSVPASG